MFIKTQFLIALLLTAVLTQSAHSQVYEAKPKEVVKKKKKTKYEDLPGVTYGIPEEEKKKLGDWSHEDPVIELLRLREHQRGQIREAAGMFGGAGGGITPLTPGTTLLDTPVTSTPNYGDNPFFKFIFKVFSNLKVSNGTTAIAKSSRLPWFLVFQLALVVTFFCLRAAVFSMRETTSVQASMRRELFYFFGFAFLFCFISPTLFFGKAFIFVTQGVVEVMLGA